jgi:hypothetical protein
MNYPTFFLVGIHRVVVVVFLVVVFDVVCVVVFVVVCVVDNLRDGMSRLSPVQQQRPSTGWRPGLQGAIQATPAQILSLLSI